MIPDVFLEFVHYIAIDPGTRTGYAVFDEKGTPLWFDAISGPDNFLDYLETINFKVAIIETYRNRGHQHDSFSTMPVSQHIGAIKRICRKKAATIIEQEPSPCLLQGLKFLDKAAPYINNIGTFKKNIHVPDELSALAHGTYYMRNHRIT